MNVLQQPQPHQLNFDSDDLQRFIEQHFIFTDKETLDLLWQLHNKALHCKNNKDDAELAAMNAAMFLITNCSLYCDNFTAQGKTLVTEGRMYFFYAFCKQHQKSTAARLN